MTPEQVWLPPGFSFLSGLPEAARRRRYLVPIQAFVDESGGLGQGRYLVFAALIAQAEDWARFSDEWCLRLGESPTIRYFKMHEAAKLRGQFKGWRAPERDAKIRSLAREISNHARVAIHIAIDLDAFMDTVRKVAVKPMSDPYFLAYHTMILAVCDDLLERGVRERFEIIFDEHAIFQQRSNHWYPVVKDISDASFAGIMPSVPMFRNDADFVAIQAADLFAWCWRRGSSLQPHSFDWVLDELRAVQQSPSCQFFDRARLEKIAADSQTIKISADTAARVRRLLGQ